jgi:hypothetical protein
MSYIFDASILRDAHRVVVKVGSSLVTNEGRGLDEGCHRRVVRASWPHWYCRAVRSSWSPAVPSPRA